MCMCVCALPIYFLMYIPFPVRRLEMVKGESRVHPYIIYCLYTHKLYHSIPLFMYVHVHVVIEHLGYN